MLNTALERSSCIYDHSTIDWCRGIDGIFVFRLFFRRFVSSSGMMLGLYLNSFE